MDWPEILASIAPSCDNRGMKDNPFADRALHQALLEKDFTGVRSALSDGANPNSHGKCTEQFHRAYSPAEYVVKRAMGKRFLEALLDAGAALGRVPSPQPSKFHRTSFSLELFDIAVRANNLAAFEVITQHRRLSEVIADQPSKWQWGLVFDTQKPHLWLSHYLNKWGQPQEESVLFHLLEKALERGDHRCLSLLLNPQKGLSEYLSHPEIIKGCANSQGVKILLEALLPKDPNALTVFKKENEHSLVVEIISKNKVRPGSLAHLLGLPPIAPLLSDAGEQEALVRACMSSYQKMQLVPVLIASGIKMPSIEGNETPSEYFARLGFTGNKGMYKPADLMGYEGLTNSLWVQAQADTLGFTSPQARPSFGLKSRPRL